MDRTCRFVSNTYRVGQETGVPMVRPGSSTDCPCNNVCIKHQKTSDAGHSRLGKVYIYSLDTLPGVFMFHLKMRVDYNEIRTPIGMECGVPEKREKIIIFACCLFVCDGKLWEGAGGGQKPLRLDAVLGRVELPPKKALN